MPRPCEPGGAQPVIGALHVETPRHGGRKRNRYKPMPDVNENRKNPLWRFVANIGLRKYRQSDRHAEQPIVFLYPAKRKNYGTTYLRNYQLYELVRSRFSGRRDVVRTTNARIRNSIVVVSKTFLDTCKTSQLERMARSNILIADPVDGKLSDGKIEHVHVLMAASVAAYDDYVARYPQKPVFYVTHHVDLRIPSDIHPPDKAFRAAYFGDPLNTCLDQAISEKVDVYRAVSGADAESWIRRLKDYNFHYCVRRGRSFDGHKPFIKGFTAAHCRSNMLIQKTAGDAAHYLGDDYPYFLPDEPSVETILERLEFARESFGGPEWRLGLQIMEEVRRRSTPERVVSEFEEMIRAL